MSSTNYDRHLDAFGGLSFAGGPKWRTLSIAQLGELLVEISDQMQQAHTSILEAKLLDVDATELSKLYDFAEAQRQALDAYRMIRIEVEK